MPLHRYQYGSLVAVHGLSTEGDNRLAGRRSGTLDPAVLKSVLDKQRMKQSNNKIIEIFFSHPKILVAITTKMKIYTHATVL